VTRESSRPPERSSQYEFEALSLAENYRSALVREFAPWLHGRVLEVGAGIGQMTTVLAAVPTVARVVAIEPDHSFCARLREVHVPDDVVHGTIDDAPPAITWDAIVSVNVLEHIEDDERELAAYRRALAPAGGALCLFVPARPEIYAPIDADFGHWRRYTRGEIESKLSRAGFRIERLRYFNSVGYLAWWLTFRLLKRRRFEPKMVRLFDRYAFPAVHALETRLFAPPIGQSVLAVARAT
jgi:SAM-dependent methyltransferase